MLFNNTNSQEQVGKTAYFDLVGDYFCSNHITRIATDGDQLHPQFLGYVLNLYQRQKAFFRLCTNWNNQSGVGMDLLKKIPIPLPDPKRQRQIVRRLEKIRIGLPLDLDQIRDVDERLDPPERPAAPMTWVSA